jgi:hypothetical protein
VRAVVLAVVALAGLPAPAAADAGPGYVSVLFGRTQWVSVGTIGGVQCQRLPNTIDLGEAAADMAARGITGVGNVVVNRIPETGFRCFNNYTTHPGWDTLSQLHASGWRFVSAGKTYADMTKLSYAGQVYESCGSLTTFADRGMPEAGGLFAYSADRYTVAIQTDPVSTCFAFGRAYDPDGPGVSVRSGMGPPWFQLTNSVNGGACADPALACSSLQTPKRYEPPADIAAAMAAAPDTWVAIQFYRFVTGAWSNGTHGWDCTSADRSAHWTTRTEWYCYDDFILVMDALRDATSRGVVVADPATVGEAWGRPIPVRPPDTTPPAVTITQPSNGSTLPVNTWVTIKVAASDDVGVLEVRFSVNGSTKCIDTLAPFTCRWKVPSKRGVTYVLGAVALDPSGNTGSHSVMVSSA